MYYSIFLFCDFKEFDECTINECSANATCTDLFNDFSCSCVDGFEGDGKVNCSSEYSN